MKVSDGILKTKRQKLSNFLNASRRMSDEKPLYSFGRSKK